MQRIQHCLRGVKDVPQHASLPRKSHAHTDIGLVDGFADEVIQRSSVHGLKGAPSPWISPGTAAPTFHLQRPCGLCRTAITTAFNVTILRLIMIRAHGHILEVREVEILIGTCRATA